MKRSMLGVLLVLTFVAVGIASAPPLTFTYSDVHANKTATETDTYAVNNMERDCRRLRGLGQRPTRYDPRRNEANHRR